MHRTAFLATLIAVLYLLHQDVWLWSTARPLFAGFLPVALTYHATYCVASALLMWAVTRYAWPSHLEGPAQPIRQERAR